MTQRKLELINGEWGFSFYKAEIESAIENLKFALVIKFLSRRPPIDDISQIIIKAWGFSVMSMINFMDKFHVFLYLANEKYYLHAWARE